MLIDRLRARVKMAAELCEFYNWIGRPSCALKYKAGLHCHSSDTQCQGYKPSIVMPIGAVEKALDLAFKNL